MDGLGGKNYIKHLQEVDSTLKYYASCCNISPKELSTETLVKTQAYQHILWTLSDVQTQARLGKWVFPKIG